MRYAESEISLARALFERRNFSGAIDALTPVTLSNPYDKDAVFLLGEIHQKAGNHKAAYRVWRQLEALLSPGEEIGYGLQIKLAKAATKLRDLDLAQAHFARALQHNEQDYDAANNLLIVSLQIAHPKRRVEIYEEHVARFEPNDVTVLIKTLLIEAHENHAAALAKIEAGRHVLFKNRDLSLFVVDNLLEQRGFALATLICGEMIALYPRESRFYDRRIRAKVAEGSDKKEVLALASGFVEAFPKKPEVARRMLRTLAAYQEWALLAAEAQKILDREPDRIDVALLAGRALVKLERNDPCRALVEGQIGRCQDASSETRLQLAKLLLATGDADAAAAQAKNILDQSDDHHEALEFYAEALMAGGNYALAQTPLAKIIHMPTATVKGRRLASQCAAALSIVPEGSTAFPDALFRHALGRDWTVPNRTARGIAIVTSSLAAGGAERQVALTASSVSRRVVQQGIDTVLIGRDLRPERRHAVMLPLARSSEFLKIVDLSDMSSEATFRSLYADESADREVLELIAAFPSELARDIIRLYAQFRSLRPRVVHLWQDGMISVGSVAAKLAGVPRIVASVRNVVALETDRRRHRSYLGAVYGSLRVLPDVLLTANSAAGARDYESSFGFEPNAIRIIRNGIDVTQLRKSAASVPAAEIRHQLRIKDDMPLLGGVFRLAPAKRPDRWIEVAKLVSDAVPDARFVIIGEGTLRDELETLAKRLGIAGRLQFLGNKSPVEPWIEAFDVMLLTSELEGLPNVLLEAQALGVPVVTTDAGGAAEALLEGVTGHVIFDGSVRRLADCCIKILQDRTARRKASAGGPAFIQQRFGLKRMVDDTLRAYGVAEGTPRL